LGNLKELLRNWTGCPFPDEFLSQGSSYKVIFIPNMGRMEVRGV